MGFLNFKHNSGKKIMNSRLKTLLLLAMVDGEVDEREANFLTKLCIEHGISSDEMNKIIKNVGKTKLVSPVTFEDKQNHIIELIGMMFCDGKVDNREIEFIKIIADKIGIPMSTVNYWIGKFAEQYKKDGIEILFQEEVYGVDDNKQKAHYINDERASFLVLAQLIFKIAGVSIKNNKSALDFLSLQYSCKGMSSEDVAFFGNNISNIRFTIPHNDEEKVKNIRMFIGLALFEQTLNDISVLSIKRIANAYGIRPENIDDTFEHIIHMRNTGQIPFSSEIIDNRDPFFIEADVQGNVLFLALENFIKGGGI